jgi:superfamily I DNA/RNA helicase
LCCESDPDCGEQKTEPGQETAEIVAGGGKHGVDGIAGLAGEIVAAHSVFGFGMADDRLNCRSSPPLALDRLAYPPPEVHSLKSETDETKCGGNWIVECTKAGVLPHEFGLFVRSSAQLDRARAAVKEAGIAFKILDERVETTTGHVSISTMHLAKGLEFRAAAVMACDDEVIPLQERIEAVSDDADLREVYDTERHLL